MGEGRLGHHRDDSEQDQKNHGELHLTGWLFGCEYCNQVDVVDVGVEVLEGSAGKVVEGHEELLQTRAWHLKVNGNCWELRRPESWLDEGLYTGIYED